MKSFLTKGKVPIIKWGMLPDETYFEGKIPEGYSLTVSPSGNYIIIDVDVHDKGSGFDNIPSELLSELESTLNYSTKHNGRHYWFKYTGNKHLANKTSGKHIDLRTNKGYVVWYPEYDIRDVLHNIKETSIPLNKWLEELFSYKTLL